MRSRDRRESGGAEGATKDNKTIVAIDDGTVRLEEEV